MADVFQLNRHRMAMSEANTFTDAKKKAIMKVEGGVVMTCSTSSNIWGG